MARRTSMLVTMLTGHRTVPSITFPAIVVVVMMMCSLHGQLIAHHRPARVLSRCCPSRPMTRQREHLFASSQISQLALIDRPLAHQPMQCTAKVFHVECVEKGRTGRVDVRQDDEKVDHGGRGLLTLWAEGVDGVRGVQRKPAEDEEDYDDKQLLRLGDFASVVA